MSRVANFGAPARLRNTRSSYPSSVADVNGALFHTYLHHKTNDPRRRFRYAVESSDGHQQGQVLSPGNRLRRCPIDGQNSRSQIERRTAGISLSNNEEHAHSKEGWHVPHGVHA